MTSLTAKSSDLLLKFALDAGNWNGMPLLSDLSQAEKGNLTDLKKSGLLITDRDEGCDWVIFTGIGKKFISKNYDIEIISD